jgi:hypothetical protein
MMTDLLLALHISRAHSRHPSLGKKDDKKKLVKNPEPAIEKETHNKLVGLLS